MQVRQHYPRAELVFAGDGPARHSMEAYVRKHDLADSVQFAGYLRSRDKARLLMNSDVFVLPTSHPEGCPVALLEAMAAELPIVTTPVGGIADFFIDGKNGILLNDVRPETVAEAISKLLKNEELRCQIGQHNQ